MRGKGGRRNGTEVQRERGLHPRAEQEQELGGAACTSGLGVGKQSKGRRGAGVDLVLAAGSICQQLPAMAGRFITSLTLSRSERVGPVWAVGPAARDLGRIVALIPVLQRVK